VTGEGEEGFEAGKEWIWVLDRQPSSDDVGHTHQVRVFHSCSSPSMLPTRILFKYVAGWTNVVATKVEWNWISFSSSAKSIENYTGWDLV